ncbi:hypothetical protein ACMFMF_007668 [Clarireedia jacksonii]
MEKNGRFENFDEQFVYDASVARALDEKTQNFVVEFSKSEARIAFDLDSEGIRNIIDRNSKHESSHDELSIADRFPVRWINIWGPNKQSEIIEHIGKHYKFSPRLVGIMKSPPVDAKPSHPDHRVTYKDKLFEKDDIETGRASINISRAQSAVRKAAETTSHYAIAQQMVNYQALDVGQRFTCIGANWMHEVPKQVEVSQSHDPFTETSQRRLWSWLILCDDSTVISLHEDTGSLKNPDDLKYIRGNTLSVLRQISQQGYSIIDALSMQSIRPALDLERPLENGREGASNLFYYLFDDWRAVYVTAALFKKSLHELEVSILEDMMKKSNESPDTRIIPRLHFLSKSIRQMHHLYRGYHSIITRLLEPPKRNIMSDAPANGSLMSQTHRSGVTLTASASQRFERLGDRLQLMILSQTEELLAEKDGLSSTYFNITSQKDSEATARLNRSAALLAKLSVLFLPVSLMTSYFSTQLSGIDNKYTFTDYWVGFAVVVSASFVCLFFFSKMLMWVSETLDSWGKEIGKVLRHWTVGCLRRMERRKRGAKKENEAELEDE